MSQSDYATDNEKDNGERFRSRGLNAVVSRLRPLVSKKAQKAYMGTLLFMSTALFIIGVSAIAYFIFYYKFIPQVELQRLVHLQFGDGHPWGTAPLGTELATLQPYDVTVKLELPRTPSNVAAGNFMLDLTLLSHTLNSPAKSLLSGNSSSAPLIAKSRRPAILSYVSPLMDTVGKLTFMPLYLAGWRREAEALEVRMMEQIEFPRGWRNLPETLQLEIHSDERMQVYNAKVEFKATFTGLRWFMYNRKILSFLVFGFMFWCVSMGSMSIVWFFLAYAFSTVHGTSGNEIKDESCDDTSIKEESDDESDVLSSRHSEPEVKEEHDSEHEEEKQDVPATEEDEEAPGSSQAAGIGTGLESAEARGVQRRRSHLFREEDS